MPAKSKPAPWLTQLRQLDGCFDTRAELARELRVSRASLDNWLPADGRSSRHAPRPDTQLAIGELYERHLHATESSLGLEALIASRHALDCVLAAESIEFARIEARRCKGLLGELLGRLQPDPA